MSFKLAEQKGEGLLACRPVAVGTGILGAGEYLVAMFVVLEKRGSSRHDGKLHLNSRRFWVLPRPTTLTAIKSRACSYSKLQ
jgi:hypothetical protein